MDVRVPDNQNSPTKWSVGKDTCENEDRHHVNQGYWGEIPTTSEDDKEMEQDLNEPMDQKIVSDFSDSGVNVCVQGVQSVQLSPSDSLDSDADLISMIDKVAKSDAHFKHQQRGEPDLTYQEKFDIARKLYHDKPDQFLARFGKFISLNDLQLFKHLESDYSVQFYIGQVRQLLDSKRSQTCVKNRRYQAMLKMTCEGEYFSNESMKERDPLLYEQMVGQFITQEEADEEVQRSMDKSDMRFSTILMNHMQWCDSNDVYKTQKDIEEGQEEESDEDDDEEEGHGEDEAWVPSEKERSMLHQEFLHTMQERFMSGKDQYFDYSTVDENTDYDNLEIREHDDEDRYFDEESPEEADQVMDDMEFDDSRFKMPEHVESSCGDGPSQTFGGPST